MSYSAQGGVSCGEDPCTESAPSTAVAEATGWVPVGNELFCASHWPLQALRFRNSANRDRILSRVRDDVAKARLSFHDYEAWNEFQQQLANFHREKGKLAPTALRELSCKDWFALHAKTGRIDVNFEAKQLEDAQTGLMQRISARMLQF